MSVPIIGVVEPLDRRKNISTVGFTTHTKPGDVEGPDPCAAWEQTACRMIGGVLMNKYRGHDWMVEVDKRQGIAKVWINALMNPSVPYVLHLKDLQPNDVMRAGGEILERFQIPRGDIDFGLVKDLRSRLGALQGRLPAPGPMGHI